MILPSTENDRTGGTPAICVAQNESRANFDPETLFLTDARAAEELEFPLASGELSLEDRTKDSLAKLRPTSQRQLLHAYRMCKLIFDGDLAAEFVDRYIDESGVRRHGNDRIRYSRLLRAVIAKAQRNGAAISKRSPSRVSSYASAINLALDLGWDAEQFEQDLQGTRRNGERHGLDFLADEGRRQRSGTPRRQGLPSLLARLIETLGLQDGDLALIVLRNEAGSIRLAWLEKGPPIRVAAATCRRDSCNRPAVFLLRARAMSDDTKNEKVGYGHPPRPKQFRPGESGNPSGRPKTKRSIRSDIEEELAATTTVKDGNNSLEMSKQRAIVKALVKAATDGNMRAVTALLNFCAKIPEEPGDEENSPEESEILEAYRKTIRTDSKGGSKA